MEYILFIETRGTAKILTYWEMWPVIIPFALKLRFAFANILG